MVSGGEMEHMNYTCKRCCIILNEQKECPICGNTDEVTPILINLQTSEKRIDLEKS